MQKLQNLETAVGEDWLKLEEKHRDQLQEKDEKLRVLKKKEKELHRMEKVKARLEDVCRGLEGDVRRIRQQKV